MSDVQASIEAQKAYCDENKLPHFAPNDGRCWNCNQNIYSSGKRFWLGKFEDKITDGISKERASKELITGCPHCFRSYCD
jgi:hypothetical protein